MTGTSDDAAFETMIRYIQESRGIDFRGYKRTSLHRRVAVRMERVNIADIATYHGLLEADPKEFAELLNTILINVTSFFREPEAWEALRTSVLPALLSEQRARQPLRIWSVGCATGEEPYSLAMMFAEAMEPADFSNRVKIYATDLDEAALSAARHATYTPAEVENVPPALLKKYFERTNNHYQVSRELRKNVIFGRHNIVHDAPISRIDLLVCRNLLIYLETETQNAVLPRLHYALVEDGVLFLGKAETQLARSRLFRPIEMKHRIFRKIPQEWRRLPNGTLGPQVGGLSGAATPAHARLLDAILDASTIAHLVLDHDGRLIFANAAARRMLEVGEADVGRPFQDLSISYRPTELRTHIEDVRRSGRPLRLEHQLLHRTPNQSIRLTIDVAPIIAGDSRTPQILLSFTDSTRTFQLSQELEAAQESLETTIEELQSANEELETTNEELQSTNEELETTNEELQSINEELETTNEERRSTNEELEAINEELRRHSEESVSFRTYAEAVMGSLNLGVIVIDQDRRVRSWNRWNETTWGVREEEVLGHLIIGLDLGLPVRQLEAVITSVLQGGTPERAELDAVDRRGRQLRCRIRVLPLTYEDNSTRGAVLTLVDAASQPL